MSRVEWAGQTLLLLPEKAIFWPRRQTLLIADPHFGKAASFGAAGIPVPAAVTQADLLRLTRALSRHGATRLIILGDFFHCRSSRDQATLRSLRDWRERHATLDVTLVRGNHDRHAGDPPCECEITSVDELALEPFHLCHDVPADREEGAAPVMAGHIHPAVTLRDGAGHSMRVPCFCLGPHRALLPAFGRFTGTHRIRPAAGDRVFAVGPDQVMEVRILRRVG